MVALVNGALSARGIKDEVTVVGQFSPRGYTGGMFAGAMAGGEAGGLLGGVGDVAGDLAGSMLGRRAVTAASGLPARMLVGVSARSVYGLAAPTRHSEPTALLFDVARSGLTVRVRPRFNVRVLELTDKASGSAIELEGNRLPVTHARDVIDELRAR